MSTLIKLAHYNYWANNRILLAFKNIGNELPESSLQLFSHLINAQIIWVSRIEKSNSPVSVFALHNVATCRQLHEDSSIKLINLVTASDADLAEMVNYSNTQGDSFVNSVEDILLQVLNHGTYHRAQIARDLRQHNIAPVNTDYITFLREQ